MRRRSGTFNPHLAAQSSWIRRCTVCSFSTFQASSKELLVQCFGQRWMQLQVRNSHELPKWLGLPETQEKCTENSKTCHTVEAEGGHKRKRQHTKLIGQFLFHRTCSRARR